MKTIHQIVDNKLDIVLDLFSEYALLEYHKNQCSPYEDSTIGYYLLEMKRTESKIKKAIRNAAAMFEIEITISDHEDIETWRNAYNRLIARWHKASRILHDLDSDNAYLENKETHQFIY